MAHELEIVEGKAQMAYAGEVPWHGLGTKVEPDLTPLQMQQAAGVDWRVKEVPTYFNFNGEAKPTGRKALVRETDGRILTEVGQNWHPVQNDEAFEFFAEFVDRGDMQMHTAGSLKNGEIVWALAKVDDDFEIFNGDKVESYLLFSNPHQYGKCIDVRFTPIRVVCNNTLTLSLKQKAKTELRLNHRSQFDAQQVKEMLGVAKSKMGQYKEMAEFLGSRPTTEDTVKQYFGNLLGHSKKDKSKLSRRGERALQVLTEQPGSEYAEGTWWTAFNALTYLTDHEFGRSNDTRLQSAWYGANRKLKNDALELAVEMADAA